MDKLYDKFPHISIILCTYSELNTIKLDTHLINVKRQDFVIHLKQHLSHHLRKQTPFSPRFRKNIWERT